MPQVTDNRLVHMHMFDLGKLKYKCRGDVRLLIHSLVDIKLPCLTVVVGKALGTDAAFLASLINLSAMKTLDGVSRGEFSDRELGSYATRPPVVPFACVHRVVGFQTDTWAR